MPKYVNQRSLINQVTRDGFGVLLRQPSTCGATLYAFAPKALGELEEICRNCPHWIPWILNAKAARYS
jgi:hypothetical protein